MMAVEHNPEEIMRAERFFYVAAGMFLLALAYHLGADGARADVRPGLSNMPAFSARATSNAYALRSDGTVWEWQGGVGWMNQGYEALTPLPVPLEEVQYFDYPWLVSTSGATWWANTTLGWQDRGVFPLSTPVTIHGKSMSAVKGTYRK